MTRSNKVNILLVDDQPAKLLSYEVILGELGENLIKANSAREALEILLKTDIAVILVDVCMPELDGFQLAKMIREHPRFQKTAIIFISAIQVTDLDRIRGYEIGAVDYVPVPVVPEMLRAKVRVFAELYRKSRDLELLNEQLEQRVRERTAELETSNEQLRQSEERRGLALAAGQMGAWEFDVDSRRLKVDDGISQIFDLAVEDLSPAEVRTLIHEDDWQRMLRATRRAIQGIRMRQMEFRVRRSDGTFRWCLASSVTSSDPDGSRLISGVIVDNTQRKEAEQRLLLLASEVDHRAKNMLAVVQSILRLTRAESVSDLVKSVEGRVQALARTHTLLSKSRWEGADLKQIISEELAPYQDGVEDRVRLAGDRLLLRPTMAQAFALVLHELATNAAKYGALSVLSGQLEVVWTLTSSRLRLHWTEKGGPLTRSPLTSGFGTRVIIASIERELSGQASFDWLPEGLKCSLSVPWQEAVAPPEAGNAPQASGEASGGVLSPIPFRGRRVFLVEDESLVAIMMAEMLTNSGFSVVGPIGNLDDAIKNAREVDIDAAVLDINLQGSTSYRIAEELLARGIPFVFATGYDAGTIDRRYVGVPVLQKPIDEQVLRSTLTACMSARKAKASTA